METADSGLGRVALGPSGPRVPRLTDRERGRPNRRYGRSPYLPTQGGRTRGLGRQHQTSLGRASSANRRADASLPDFLWLSFGLYGASPAGGLGLRAGSIDMVLVCAVILRRCRHQARLSCTS
jgi:hypothetical protein